MDDILTQDETSIERSDGSDEQEGAFCIDRAGYFYLQEMCHDSVCLFATNCCKKVKQYGFSIVQGQPDGKYLNWIRGSVSHLYLKESIEGFIDNKVTDFYDKLHRTVPQPYSRHGPANQQHPRQQVSSGMQVCTTCSQYDIKKRNSAWSVDCSSNVCSTWIKYISNYHVDGDDCTIARDNLKPQLWPSHPWEVAKWFLHVGSENVKSAKDADVAAILKLLMTCQFMFKFYKTPTLLEEVLTIRNRLMHSKDLTVTDAELHQDTGKMISLLKSLILFTPDETLTVQRAIDSITKLQSKTMSLTRDKEITALHSRMQAVDSELTSLRGKCSDHDKTSKDLNKTEQELNSLYKDYRQTKALIKQLEESKERFDKFVQDNGLDQDLAMLSARLQKHDKKFNQLDKRLDQQDQMFDDQDQQIEQHGQRLDQQDQRADDLDQRIDQHDQRLNEYDLKIHTLTENVTNQLDIKADTPLASCLSDGKRKDLQALLMTHYKHTCLIVQDPIEGSVGLEYMYVAPAIKVLQQSKGRDGLGNVNEGLTNMSCKQIFYNKDYQCKNIYITGDAGTGKSMLCRNLVRLWCEAHGGFGVAESEESESESDSDEYDNDIFENILDERTAKNMSLQERKDRCKEDRQILSQFKLLFFITLRDSLSEYRVTDMIQSQILQHYEKFEDFKLSSLLKNECCLVIVDGLDEWTCPEGSTIPHFVNSGIPFRDLTIETSVFLTTTRSWKFNLLQHDFLNFDKHVELTGISKRSASKLCNKVIKLLCKRKPCSREKHEFFRTLKQKGLDHFKTIPVILVQLICIWFDDNELPTSQVQLYCDVIEHLLTKAKKNISKESINTPKDRQSDMSLLNCFIDHPCCQNNQNLIHCLSRVAFEGLFDKTKENSLVFKSSQMEVFGIGQKSVEVCLKSGIMSQNRVLEKCSVSQKKISFLHKKLQEFLASLFIACHVDSHGVFQQMVTETATSKITHITELCSTIETCLDLSQVYIFMSGLRPDLTQQLLTHFIHVVTADKHKQIQKYRQTIYGKRLIRDIQTCITDCTEEVSHYGCKYVNLYLTDFHITDTTLYYVRPLLFCTKTTEIKSVYLKTYGIDSDQLTAITGHLQHCNAVQKLHLDDHSYCMDISTVAKIVNNNLDTLTCLYLSSQFTATAELVTDIICSFSSKYLMALGMWHVRLTHDHIEQILTRLPHSPTIRQLEMCLYCKDHDLFRCTAARIDLSTMIHIQRLCLDNMYVDNLQSVSHCVERVSMCHVKLPVTALCEFSKRLSKTRRHVTVELIGVTVTLHVDVEAFLRTCHGLVVTYCRHNDCDNTWTIAFTTSSQ